ncbi:MAG: hypothetical protein L0H64_09015 [Pseudonocardia sp.]|nr:hypothetical protein [Pseudonocardia sp.]
MTDPLDALADELYSAPPANFVAVRDEAVRAARESGDRGFATAAGRLRRPTRAAWLANLLARRRREQLDGLLDLAGSLADAQRTLDGEALRALSTRRRELVSAMAREAGRLAREVHESVTDSLLRELADILEAALADPAVADEVRSGRLTRTISYSGFGPGADPGAVARPRGPAEAATEPGPAQPSAAERAEAARRERERDARRRDLADAERLEAQARERRDAAEAAHEAGTAAHEAARKRVAALTEELARAQARERATAGESREAAAAARPPARDPSRARLDTVSGATASDPAPSA